MDWRIVAIWISWMVIGNSIGVTAAVLYSNLLSK